MPAETSPEATTCGKFGPRGLPSLVILSRVREADTVGQVLPLIELLRDLFDARPRPLEGVRAEKKVYRRLGSVDCLQYGCCTAIRITPLLTVQLWHFSASLSGGTVVVSELPRCVPEGAFVKKVGAQTAWFDQRHGYRMELALGVDSMTFLLTQISPLRRSQSWAERRIQQGS